MNPTTIGQLSIIPLYQVELNISKLFGHSNANKDQMEQYWNTKQDYVPMAEYNNGVTTIGKLILQLSTWWTSDWSYLDIARIYNLDSKAIYFVLAFPQAYLDVDIWMYLPIGLQIDGQIKGDSDHQYLLKLNKSLYG